ncbi:Uncharacterised protein [Corynebacterium imitans]|uniref:Uncharacterized protein n=1 Tax=Corynebacterium imitans TaxID=156978 RepID=A0A076NRB0_9CORY|nr:hypothetical protein [Corynebacterium imitans]AIJ33467.1 hypothetical protein CIMIT_05765 [Corynebacterium imitans]SNV70841.1 Uncharacterised protein [Corynebacterium imitans]
MDYEQVVPTELPPGEHPYAGMFVGLVAQGRESAVARLVFDELGARLYTPDARFITHAWAVDFALPNGREEVSVGDTVTWRIPGAGVAGVRLVSGALPPGIRLERHTGRLVGEFTTPGVYSATFAVGPAVKLDLMGGTGLAGDAVKWMPIDQPRTPAKSDVEVPKTLDTLTAQELDALTAEAQRLMRIKAQEVRVNDPAI